MSSETAPKRDVDLKTEKDIHSLAEGAMEGDATYTTEQEGKIKRKIDTYLLPVLTIMYLVSYLDRSNSRFGATVGRSEN